MNTIFAGILFITGMVIILLATVFDMSTKKEIVNVEMPLSYDHGIPRIIYRTHRSKTVPSCMHEFCHNKWVRLNPKYSVRWYDDRECDTFMNAFGSRESAAYKNLIPGAYKADLWRLCVLYQTGGVYVDSYATPHESLDMIFDGCFDTKSVHHFISVKDRWNTIHNGFMAATAGNPLLRQAIDDICDKVEKRDKGKHALDVTGPMSLAKSINRTLGRPLDFEHPEGFTINPHSGLYLLSFQNDIPNRFKWSSKSGMLESQLIVKNSTVVIAKKYSFVHCLYCRGTYPEMWKKDQVFRY
jgi:hypothetical protein